jgi:dihydropteroate synthase
MHPILKKRFAVMGIVNVTPDSFFDGGKYFSTESAVDHGLSLFRDGADILDIGGESTRPGAPPVAPDEECERVLPVIRELSRRAGVPLSVDTTKAAVAQAALDAGASWVNDISAGRFDPAMPVVVARNKCPVILMHSRETPATMQQEPRYDDVVAEVKSELSAAVDVFCTAGAAPGAIILDPGIGFAKRLEDNLTLLAHLKDIAAIGCPVCVGVSRKSFIGRITGREAGQRLAGSLAAVAASFYNGATLFRVHDVRETVEMLKVLEAIQTCNPLAYFDKLSTSRWWGLL